jgi:hypothetical protein
MFFAKLVHAVSASLKHEVENNTLWDTTRQHHEILMLDYLHVSSPYYFNSETDGEVRCQMFTFCDLYHILR